MTGVPSAESQIVFLKKIQTLFDDSSFNATYKYALLITLTDLAIEHGDDSGNPLELKGELITTRFAEIYWPQIKKYSTGINGTTADVLVQNRGKQAKIINTLLSIQKQLGINDFSKVINHTLWQKKIGAITQTVWNNPVLYLQEDSNQFLYPYSKDKTKLTLTAEAAYCLRKFSEFIIQYAKQGWVNHIKANNANQDIIEPKDDLVSFLFDSNKSDLTKLTPYLIEHQHGKCFYCSKSVVKKSDVDHFIPWKKYPRNIAQNLVLSCPGCNRSKSDMLAAKIHLQKWVAEILPNDERSSFIASQGFISDRDCSTKVAHWAYQNAATAQGNTWVRPKCSEVIGLDFVGMVGGDGSFT
jgi:5-methylcytosine-specific restriction endonuclease McrA